MKVDDWSVAKFRQREDDCAPTIAFAHILHRIAIADEEFALTVYHPLQSIAEESVRIVENDGLNQSGRFCERNTLHEADIFHAIMPLLGTL